MTVFIKLTEFSKLPDKGLNRKNILLNIRTTPTAFLYFYLRHNDETGTKHNFKKHQLIYIKN